MKIFILNAGSSSLKYDLIDADNETTVFRGTISRIGPGQDSKHDYINSKGDKLSSSLKSPDHGKAIETVLSVLEENGISLEQVGAIGHRIVHGGAQFKAPIVLTDEIVSDIEKYSPLAPLHNPVNLVVVNEARKRIKSIPHIGIFDTAFHHTIPEQAYMYALPYEYFEKGNVRRYGFHGNSHEYVIIRAAEYLETPVHRLKLITCHLGNGASLAAIDYGRSIDTSMGLTPLEGVVMGTRSGDVDPGVVFHLARQYDLGIDEIDKMLNKKSGLLGLSGLSNDVREILAAAEDGNRQAALAMDVFCYRVKKYIGSYIAALGWVDGIIFTGGIGENASPVRARILDGMEKLGIGISPVKNDKCKVDQENPVYDISSSFSHVHVLAVATNEELMMARKCLQALNPDE